MEFTNHYMKLRFKILCFLMFIGTTAFAISPAIKIHDQKSRIEQWLNSNGIVHIKWVNESEITDRYKVLVSQKFYVRIFNKDYNLILPNKEEPGCYAYESLYIDSLFETELSLSDFLKNPVYISFDETSNRAYCLMSIQFKSKSNYKRKLRRFIKFKKNNPTLNLAIIFVEVV